MEMKKDTFSFKLGNFKCMVVSDRMSLLPGITPQRAPGQHEAQVEQTTDIMSMVIKTGEHTLLIDTGLGSGVEPNAGKLIQNLQAEGVQCEDIDTVIFSHGHGDHVGGNTDAQGRPVFPNARYIIHRKEWEFWTSNPDLSHVNIPEDIKQMLFSITLRNLSPIQDVFTFLDDINDKTEIIPGIDYIMAPGHTPSHIALVISSGGEQLYHVGDMFHHPSEFTQRDPHGASDMLPEQAIQTNQQILSLVAKSKTLLFASHFPFPGLGYIERKGDNWLWKPMLIGRGESR
jgi:glyoxylase-like metal-dependent hydrolase (beta-lactamase superfamily II)